MSDFIYVDNSNVFIEGKRVSAVQKGLAMNIGDAINNRILDNTYRLDFGRLHSFLSGNDPSKIRRAVLFGSRPPQNDSLWNVAQAAGFEIVVEDRNVANREKKLDTGIVAAMMRDAYTRADKDADTLTLVSGDGDFVPAVRQLTEDGFQVEVVFWGHASQQLKDCCMRFIDLDPHLGNLSFNP
jgi:uncharacterized LabA/DUF88 family protein